MFQELLEQFKELEKTASPEELEALSEGILKEAGLGALVGKGLDFGVKKVVGAAVKHPIKTLGTALTVGAVAGAAGKGAGAAKQELARPITYNSNANMPPQQRKPKLMELNASAERIDEMLEKIAARDMQDGSRDRQPRQKSSMGAYKYLPHTIGGAIGTLAVADIIKNGPKSAAGAVGRGLYTGAKNVSRPVRLFSNIVKETGSAIKRKGNIKDAINKARSAANIDPQDRSTIRKYIDAAIKSRSDRLSKDIGGLVDKELRSRNIDPKKQTTLQKAVQGLAYGTGVTGSSLAIQALGDEYFNRKDKDELRRRLRETRTPLHDAKYRTPKQQANDILRQQRGQYGQGRPRNPRLRPSFEKSASLKSFLKSDTMKDIVKNDVLKSLKTSVLMAAVPTAASVAINRNIKTNMSKIRQSKKDDIGGNSSRMIIEVPLKEINKSALEKTAKFKVSDKFKAKALENARLGIKSISWAAGPTIVTALTGRNIRGTFEKMTAPDKLGPVEPGKARIIIETNKGTGGSNSHANNYQMLMMSKGASEVEKNVTKDLKNLTTEEAAKIEARKNEALQNLKLVAGVKRKQRMNQ